MTWQQNIYNGLVKYIPAKKAGIFVFLRKKETGEFFSMFKHYYIC
jgi:hypothetical protein